MEICTIGLGIAKRVFQLHVVDAVGKIIVKRPLRRSQVFDFFGKIPPCLVGMEACATAHYWARQIAKIGHQVRLMPASYVKAYVKRNKNDRADAAAICEAVTRPSMRFVPVKSVEQQAALMLHRTRDLLVRQRTQLINAVRGHLVELGLVAAQGCDGVKELIAIVAAATQDLPRLTDEALRPSSLS
jgi:transposase